MDRNTELLDYLAKRTGNSCLSNLRESIETPYLDKVIAGIPQDMFTEAQWHETAEYLTGRQLDITPVFKLRELLIGWALARPFSWLAIGNVDDENLYGREARFGRRHSKWIGDGLCPQMPRW